MTLTHTYDDPAAFDRRWGRCTPAQVSALAQEDPLLFLADHLPVSDRRAGCLVIQADLGPAYPPMMIVMNDGPPRPDVDECLAALVTIVERIDAESGHGVSSDDGETCVHRLGLVFHRTGGNEIEDVDRAWAQALDGAARWYGLEPVGVLIRTARGHLVRVPPTAYAVAG